MKFDWNPNKAAQNLKNHRVSFDEAATVFDDDLSVTFFDPDHSDVEDRYVIIGMSKENRLLLVAHADRGDYVRIISARELTNKERKAHESGHSSQ